MKFIFYIFRSLAVAQDGKTKKQTNKHNNQHNQTTHAARVCCPRLAAASLPDMSNGRHNDFESPPPRLMPPGWENATPGERRRMRMPPEYYADPNPQRHFRSTITSRSRSRSSNSTVLRVRREQGYVYGGPLNWFRRFLNFLVIHSNSLILLLIECICLLQRLRLSIFTLMIAS